MLERYCVSHTCQELINKYANVVPPFTLMNCVIIIGFMSMLSLVMTDIGVQESVWMALKDYSPLF